MGSNTKGALLALMGYAVFSTHDVIVKYLGSSYSPFQIVFFSVVFGFPLASIMLVRDATVDTMRPHHPWWNLIRSVSILLSSVCVFYAFSVLPLAQTYSILFTLPLMITLLSIPMLGEKVGFHRGGAILVGFVGVLIAVRPTASGFSLGHLAAFVGAFSSALAAIIVRKIGRNERALVLLLFPMLGSFLVMGGAMPFVYKPMPFQDLAAAAVMAFLSFTALSCMIGAYKEGEAVVVAPMQYSQFVWATFYGLLFFNEVPDMQTIVGAAIIIASGVYIVLRENRKNISENTPVLRTRGRIAAGNYFQIGPFIRQSRRNKKEKAQV
jgi:drug/metabolite transporter (DMT)-like permease